MMKADYKILSFLRKHPESSGIEMKNKISEKAKATIERLADEPSLYPEQKRKPREERISDLTAWLQKYRYHNIAYNECGMDIVGFDRWDEYVDHYSGRLEEYRGKHYYMLNDGIIPRPVDGVLSDDKYAFYSYINTIAPGKTPKVYYLISSGRVVAPMDKRGAAMKAICSLPDGKYVAKPNLGQCGRNLFVFNIKNREINFICGNSDDLKAAFMKESYVIQEYITQHPDIAAFNPSSVNTVRIVTAKLNFGVYPYCAIFRMGTGKSFVDNAAAGGTFVGIDLETGRLKEKGNYHNKPDEYSHPISRIVYSGYQLPYWKESLELVKYLHRFYRFTPTMGWDVAITEKGPLIIENNFDWSYPAMQHACGGLRKKFEELKTLP